MKVSELEGGQLDLWVARAEGKCYTQSPGVWGNALINDMGRLSIAKNSWDCARYFEPSSNWTHGGPIIERERIGVMPRAGLTWAAWMADDMDPSGVADQPLVAAMRAYVASKFGEEVPE